MDTLYSLKTVVPVVLNAKQNQVYADHIETEIRTAIRQGGRFEIDELGTSYLKGRLATVQNASLDAITVEEPELARRGVDALILADVETDPKAEAGDPAGARLSLALINARTREQMDHELVPIGNRFLLDSLSIAAREGIAALRHAVPFGATVTAREGEKVILDRGFPWKVGTRLAVSTLERVGGTLVHEPVGEVIVTRMERDLSFARVLNERAPGAIVKGNKLRVMTRELATVPARRSLASETADLAFKRGTLGVFNIDVGPSIVQFNDAGANKDFRSQQGVYPGAELKGELWLTSRLFASLGFGIAVSSLSSDPNVQPASVSSNVNRLDLALGYRFRFLDPNYGPELTLRAGYGRQQFQMDTTSDPLSFNTSTYSGILIGGTLRFPLLEKLGLAFDFDTLLFPSVSESPVDSGNSTSVSGLEFAAGAYYNLARDFDVTFRALFQNYSADFAGSGSRPVSLLSASQSTRGFLLGVTKYF